MLTPEQYEAKRQARYERLLAAAEKAERDGKASITAGDTMFKAIPFGQPILVGHHSERRNPHRMAGKRKPYTPVLPRTC